MLAIIARHAESLNNRGDVQHPDTDLSETGWQQTQRLARRLASLTIRAVYSSPYRRALQTALPVAAAHDLPVRLRGELCEAHIGTTLDLASFQLPDAAALQREFTRAVPDPDAPDAAAWPPLIESIEQVVARQRALIAHLRARWTDESDLVVLIGHGLPVARFIETWLLDAPGPAFRFIIVNAAINCLRDVGGVRSLLCLNECSHLVDLPPPHGGVFTPTGAFRTEPPKWYW